MQYNFYNLKLLIFIYLFILKIKYVEVQSEIEWNETIETPFQKSFDLGFDQSRDDFWLKKPRIIQEVLKICVEKH